MCVAGGPQLLAGRTGSQRPRRLSFHTRKLARDLPPRQVMVARELPGREPSCAFRSTRASRATRPRTSFARGLRNRAGAGWTASMIVRCPTLIWPEKFAASLSDMTSFVAAGPDRGRVRGRETECAGQCFRSRLGQHRRRATSPAPGTLQRAGIRCRQSLSGPRLRASSRRAVLHQQARLRERDTLDLRWQRPLRHRCHDAACGHPRSGRGFHLPVVRAAHFSRSRPQAGTCFPVGTSIPPARMRDAHCADPRDYELLRSEAPRLFALTYPR